MSESATLEKQSKFMYGMYLQWVYVWYIWSLHEAIMDGIYKMKCMFYGRGLVKGFVCLLSTKHAMHQIMMITFIFLLMVHYVTTTSIKSLQIKYCGSYAL